MSKPLLNLEIIDLTIDGDGIAKDSGKTIFVKGATLGDEVAVEIIKNNPSYSIGQTKKLLKTSSLRANPVCQHFELCGGCQLQNLAYFGQLNYKENFLKQNLIRISGLKDPKINNIVPSAEYNYRNKVQIPFGKNSHNLLLGYYQPDSHKIVDMQECQLQDPDFTKITLAIKKMVQDNNISIYDEKSHSGILRHLVIRKSCHDNSILIGLVINSQTLPKQDLFLSCLKNLKLSSHHISSFVININQNKTNKIFGLKSIKLWGPGYLLEKIGGYFFQVTLDTFLQINKPQAENLYQYLISKLPANNNLIIDAYCGIGTIALNISDFADKVIGIENNPQAIKAALDNIRLNKITNCEFICSPAEKVPPHKLAKAEIFIVDPPRKGLDPAMIKTILKIKPEKIFYISCNPATLARDLKELLTNNSYKLIEITPFDFFPQTTHIESLTILEKNY